MTHLQYINSAHGGDGWCARSLGSSGEQGGEFGNYGQRSEFDKLLHVVLHRPEFDEAALMHIPSAYHFDEPMNLSLAQAQHDQLAGVLRSCGVEIEYLRPEHPRPNHLFVRDLFTMTPFGAVISRMAAQIRAGEEFDALRFISDRRIPIVAQVLGEGVFEGPDLMFLRPDLALCATSIRSNLKGVRQVTRSLEELGVEVIQIQSTYGCGHLDGVANVIARDKVLVIPRMISLTAVAAFQTCGYEIIELSDMDEIAKMAVNVLAVDDGVVLIPSDCVRTIRLLEAKRVECIPVEVSELRKGGGSIHCMTGVLRRAVGR